MAYDTFKPTIWSHYIQRELEKKCKLVADCWKQFEGEAKHGGTVKVLGVGSPTIGDYKGNMNPAVPMGDPETIAGTSTDLLIDQAKYFNFMVDDVDKAQSVPGLMEKLMEEATHKLALASDSYVASLAKIHELNELARNDDTPKMVSVSTAVTSATAAKKAIDGALLALRENDVDVNDNVVIEITPFLYQLFRDNLIELKTNNNELIRKGVVGMYDGAEVKLTNNLYKEKDENNNEYTYCMVRTKKAIAYASQIHNVEAFRPEKYFSDAIKGLDVFGAAIVRPKELYVLKVHK